MNDPTTDPDGRPRPAYGIDPAQVDQVLTTLKAMADRFVKVAADGLAQLRATMPDLTGLGPAAAGWPVNQASPVPPSLPGLCRLIEPTMFPAYVPMRGERAVSFLGGIPDVEPWHDRAVTAFADRWVRDVGANVPLALIVPRRRDTYVLPDGTKMRGDRPWTDADQRAQTRWEHTNIRPKNGVALFHFPASRPDRPQPTSLMEVAQAWGRVPLVVSADPGYPYRRVLEQQCPEMDVPLFDTLGAAIDEAIARLVITDPARGLT